MNKSDPRKHVDQHLGQGTADKLEGRAKEMAGRAQAQAGRLFGDRDMEAEGQARHAEGSMQRHKGEAKEKIEQLGEAMNEKMEKLKGGAQALADKAREKLERDQH
jgi:uncharacterized protein YjbJ (UPF0337 family)